MNCRPTGPVSSWWRRVKRRERHAILTTAAVSVVVVLLAILVVVYPEQRQHTPEVIGGSTPVGTALYLDPHMQSITAAREDSRFDPIARTPQAKWFTDWSTPATARSDVSEYLAGAAAANAVPVLVLYRLPTRDCGPIVESGGARDEQEYKAWVDGVAAALMGHDEAMVIIEPDALPGLPCQQDDRLSVLSYAVDALSTTGARVYVDAGHENWWPAAEIAGRLKRVGVDKIAGFSLNVANFYPVEGEVRFAESVRSELSKLGITDSHYVIDIGRNGAGPQDSPCNPPGARLGKPPRLFQGGALDGLLWVKNPGQTDGPCRGGPDSGFWAPAALSLLGLEADQATSSRGDATWVLLVAACGLAAAGLLCWAGVGRRRTGCRCRSALRQGKNRSSSSRN